MTVNIRPAAESDQGRIVQLIRQARLNQRNLYWSNFLVAEVAGEVVGVRQLKRHPQGTREIASGFVLPAYRRQGISARLMNEILSRESGPLYLMCDQKWTGYYEGFGFRKVEPRELPADFGREYSLGRIITTFLSLFARRKIRVVPMKRDG